MAQITNYDAIAFDKLEFPYNRIEAELSSTPRFIRGHDSYVTYGGKLTKRPGTLEVGSNLPLAGRIDRLQVVETLDAFPLVYVLASVYSRSTGLWSMWYIRLSATTPVWTPFPNLRQVQNSIKPHELVVARGNCYIMQYTLNPLEKLPNCIFDTNSVMGAVNIRPWGLQPPPNLPTISGTVFNLTQDITATTTTFTVSNSGAAPATPFVVVCEREQFNVTANAAGSFTATRGYQSPSSGSTAAPHAKGTQLVYRDWAASSHPVQVNFGWKYAISYESQTTHVSVRSADTTNQDLLPNDTGPFQALVPKLVIPGTDSVKNKIHIWRTTDGGGTYYQLDTIANPGPGNFTYYDNTQRSGGSSLAANDPISDDNLPGIFAPSLVSNSAPPRVTSPKVTGVDPAGYTTPLAYFQGRIWYAVDNILFYSGQEEIVVGVPEESFPSGFTGNFIRYQHPIMNLAATNDALYIFTLQETHKITGNNRETFSTTIWFANIGAPYGNPKAVCHFGNNVSFLTHDFRIGLISDGQLSIVSDPLYTDIQDIANAGSQIELNYWGSLDKEWLVMCAVNNDTTQCKQWIYDLKKSNTLKMDFWNLPWTIPAVCSLSGRIFEAEAARRLVFAPYDNANDISVLSRMDPTGRTGTDFLPTVGATGFGMDVVSNLYSAPNGNHINALNKPVITPILEFVQLERLLFGGDNDPNFFFFVDDFWTQPRVVDEPPNDPWRREQSKAYRTVMWRPVVVGQRFAVEFTKLPNAELFEAQTLILGFLPRKGAD